MILHCLEGFNSFLHLSWLLMFILIPLSRALSSHSYLPSNSRIVTTIRSMYSVQFHNEHWIIIVIKYPSLPTTSDIRSLFVSSFFSNFARRPCTALTLSDYFPALYNIRICVGMWFHAKLSGTLYNSSNCLGCWQRFGETCMKRSGNNSDTQARARMSVYSNPLINLSALDITPG